MRNPSFLTTFLVVMCAIIYFFLPSLSAGIFTGIFSLFLVRLFLAIVIKTGNIGFVILLLFNIIKFGIVIFMLFVFIRWFRLDAVYIAFGYTTVFLLTITEIFIRKPKEL